MCCHLHHTKDLEDWFRPHADTADSPFCAIISAQAGRASQRLHDAYLGPHFRWNEIRHSSLGGLTNAKIRVGWKGPRPLPKAMEPGRRRLPIRPLARFLEPSVRLGAWRRAGTNKASVWAPSRDGATAFPWPWTVGTPWVEAASCYLGGGMVERPMTEKERAQLMDLSKDWAPTLLTHLWDGNQGRNPPLRLLAETAIGVVPWIQGTRTPVLNEDTLRIEVDWGRIRPPWIRDGGGNADFVGWNWVVDTVGEERVATKADDAGVDLSLWAVGGEGTGMEAARQTLRNFLLRVWKRRLYRFGGCSSKCGSRSRLPSTLCQFGLVGVERREPSLVLALANGLDVGSSRRGKRVPSWSTTTAVPFPSHPDYGGMDHFQGYGKTGEVVASALRGPGGFSCGGAPLPSPQRRRRYSGGMGPSQKWPKQGHVYSELLPADYGHVPEAIANRLLFWRL
jgi:hypothetical protein